MSLNFLALARLKRILVMHDLHPDSDNAAWRAGLMARAQGGWTRIVHANAWRQPEDAQERLASITWRMQEHLQVAVTAHAYRGFAMTELRHAAKEADLVVVRARTGLDALLGLNPVRIAALCGRPTLVVRTPANVAYRRVLFGARDDMDVTALQAAMRALSDGKEAASVAPSCTAPVLLEQEHALFCDLVVLSNPTPSAARRLIASTKADTLLLPGMRMMTNQHRRWPRGQGRLLPDLARAGHDGQLHELGAEA